ncbi:MAG TPA: glycosyltransferase 87 family protein [Gemmatimonadales bacterium]|nr:glycosyltransferase 87 family protein [Gemmatimonadales bacterium]
MNLRPLSPRERNTLLGLALVYAAVVIPVGIHRGGDLVQEILQSDRLLRGLPLYGANPEKGVYWPPFALFALTPLALVARWSMAFAQAIWAVFNVWCVVWCLAYAGRRWSWGVAVISLLCVAKPLQANFEHQNVTVVLLYLVMLLHRALERGRAGTAGGWAGIATALKAFPGLLLVYFLVRRRWKALVFGVLIAGAATILAMIRYGPVGSVDTVWSWFTTSRTAPIMAGFGTQPLGNLLHVGFGLGTPWVVGIEIVVGLILLWSLLETPAGHDWVGDLGLVSIFAALITPIGWFYYQTLAFPGWIGVLTVTPPARHWARTTVTAIAGVLLSGILTSDHLYPEWMQVIKRFNYVWGALLLLSVLAFDRFTARLTPVSHE